MELERSLAITKAELKAKKAEVADMVTELESTGRDLARKYETIQTQTTQLRDLPRKIDELEASIAKLKETQTPGSNPLLNMPLERTLAAVREKELEQADLNRQIEQLQAQLPRKTRELDRLEAELQPLEAKRLATTAAAREAQKRKEAALGGAGDDLEERGRWWRGVESGLRELLGVQNQA